MIVSVGSSLRKKPKQRIMEWIVVQIACHPSCFSLAGIFPCFFFFFFFSDQRGRSHITETWLVREMTEIWTPAASWNTVLNDDCCCWDRRRDLRVMVLRIKRRFNRCFCCSLCINTAVSLQTENEIGSFYWNHQCLFPRLTPEWLSKLNRKKKVIWKLNFGITAS